ncbi:hypothetical protein FJT64_013990 [Amphibalanus amphitrite]|uniref:Uncharacterized protein n=1 Tax=Amphibalanus amphitrite TaxID=1232801 RepID=A0A6A4V0W8_AMPAM|nr:hypothetical protein FJT64_013990 [Amphibalanus amphitrite]
MCCPVPRCSITTTMACTCRRRGAHESRRRLAGRRGCGWLKPEDAQRIEDEDEERIEDRARDGDRDIVAIAVEEDAGFQVVAMICDLSPTNRGFLYSDRWLNMKPEDG